jgi:acetoacetate decarboxylase
MDFKHRELDHATVMRSLNEPGFLLKIEPGGIDDVRAAISAGL